MNHFSRYSYVLLFQIFQQWKKSSYAQFSIILETLATLCSLQILCLLIHYTHKTVAIHFSVFEIHSLALYFAFGLSVFFFVLSIYETFMRNRSVSENRTKKKNVFSLKWNKTNMWELQYVLVSSYVRMKYSVLSLCVCGIFFSLCNSYKNGFHELFKWFSLTALWSWGVWLGSVYAIVQCAAHSMCLYMWLYGVLSKLSN